jgi:murein L,D-transpeptidase YcbB/YkuD
MAKGPAAKKKTAPAAGATGKTVHTAGAPAKTGAGGPALAKSAISKPVASKSGTAKPTVSKSGASKSAAARLAAAQTAASKITASRTGSKAGAKSKKTVVARRPPTQQQPSADRYKEIQQALADKGYFQGPVDGAWNPGSVEALKRFQKDQNLDADGKIGSLSLIALGLGPKRGFASAQSAPSSSEPLDPPPVAQPQP